MSQAVLSFSCLDLPEGPKDHSLVFELLRYWHGKKADRQIPLRSSLRPEEITRHLPFLSLIEFVSSSERPRFRLSGTETRRLLGFDTTGTYVNEIKPAALAAGLEELLNRLRQDKVPQFVELRQNEPSGTTTVCHLFLLPFCNDSAEVSQVCMLIDYGDHGALIASRMQQFNPLLAAC